jgi:hypothetical protein
MKLYKATYEFRSANTTKTESSEYILAPDFQSALKLAETVKGEAEVIKVEMIKESVITEK